MMSAIATALSTEPPTAPPAAAFASFWMAGFEGADHTDLHGTTIDMASVTGHAQQFAADYRRAAAMKLRTVRESVGWRVCAPRTHKQLDFSRLLRAADAAQAADVQVLWTLMHYGTPPNVQVTDVDFAQRFAEFAGAAATQLRRHAGTPSIYNPINEIGFLAWALASQRILGGECTEPDGYVVKAQLVKAALCGIEAIRSADPGARFMHIEPLIHVVAPEEEPERAQDAADFCSYQWQAWDMLMGRTAPELGGSPDAMQWLGVNHYHDAQWEIGTGVPLDWLAPDARRRPFASLLQEAADRYRLPVVVAETSHFGEGRARWLDGIAAETQRAMQAGVDVQGLCLYPAVDRPDWNNHAHWHHSGLWDALSGEGASSLPVPAARQLCAPYAAALQRWQQRLRP